MYFYVSITSLFVVFVYDCDDCDLSREEMVV